MLIDTQDKKIKEEGERMVPSFHKGAIVYGEHIVRYESILPLLNGKTVLDIAAGSGYGSYILAGAAKKVYGVEIDEEAVAYARRNYARRNIEFKQGSAEAIPLEDHSVDVVVTFETIEHIEDYRKFMSEIKRVLKPDGFALISTPNDLEFPEGNHFHLHEFTQDELEGMVKDYFKNCKFTYQYTWLYTAVTTETEAGKEGPLTIETMNVAPVPKEKAIYFMAICSDLSVAKLNTRLVGAISEHWSARQQQDKERSIESERASLWKEINNLRGDLQKIQSSRGWSMIQRLYRIKHILTGYRQKSR